MARSLPAGEQRELAAELTGQAAGLERRQRRKLRQLPNGRYYNPNGIPDDDPIFGILEGIEEERHRSPGPPPPEFD